MTYPEENRRRLLRSRRMSDRLKSYSLLGMVLVVMVACVGLKMRDSALLPVMSGAFAGISADVEAGIAARGLDAGRTSEVRGLVERVRSGLRGGDRAALRGLAWPELQDLAEAGILDRLGRGAIVEGVARSLLERLDRFTESWNLVLAR